MDHVQWISRVSILSLLTIACLAGHYFRLAWLRRAGLWLLLLGLLLSLFVVKTDSTRSRLFIWQRTADLLATDVEAGLPFHRYRPFNPAFNHTQAAWFFQHGIAGHEAWLANDGYYAFYEVLQLWYEWGWGAMINERPPIPTPQAERLKADAAAYLQQTDTTVLFIFNLHHYTWQVFVYSPGWFLLVSPCYY